MCLSSLWQLPVGWRASIDVGLSRHYSGEQRKKNDHKGVNKKKIINVLFLSVYKCKCYCLKLRITVKHSFTFKGLYHLSTNVIAQVDFIIKASGKTVARQTKYKKLSILLQVHSRDTVN